MIAIRWFDFDNRQVEIVYPSVSKSVFVTLEQHGVISIDNARMVPAKPSREDDRNETVIRNRIQVYEKQTSILKTYYLEKFNDLFFSIDGERSVDEIAGNIKKIIL